MDSQEIHDKFMDIHGPQRINPYDFGEPQSFHLSSEISQHVQDWHIILDVHGFQCLYPNNVGDLLLNGFPFKFGSRIHSIIIIIP